MSLSLRGLQRNDLRRVDTSVLGSSLGHIPIGTHDPDSGHSNGAIKSGPNFRDEDDRKMRRQFQRGATTVEMTLVGIPLMFVLVSIFEMSRGMWVYHTVANAV